MVMDKPIGTVGGGAKITKRFQGYAFIKIFAGNFFDFKIDFFD